MAILKIGGSAEQDTGRLILPVEGAVGIYFANQSKLKLSNNFATGRLTNQVVGNPTPQPSHTALSLNGGYIQTPLAESAEMTMFAIYKQPVTTSAGVMICSNYGNPYPSTFGIGLQVTSTGKVTFIAAQLNASTSTAGGCTVNATGWTLVAGRVKGNANYIKNMTNGELSEATYTSRLGVASNPLLRIGACYAARYNESIDVMAVVVFNRALADSEINSVSDVLRRYAAKHGVTV
ncbi:LamG-like jellyroll fold domain-containing protein [Psychrobacter arenosus]|uniref:LamG-like jellyroll fold domain-containing protein n=1 Tax=Psychrobacter arenosus TaxID=256326 RepID=UPI00191B1CA7|nr:LamG-like jellyroll fold domain-containing protein [Psychrobacter arenosus]